MAKEGEEKTRRNTRSMEGVPASPKDLERSVHFIEDISIAETIRDFRDMNFDDRQS